MVWKESCKSGTSKFENGHMNEPVNFLCLDITVLWLTDCRIESSGSTWFDSIYNDLKFISVDKSLIFQM